jgi:hypothetical protein
MAAPDWTETMQALKALVIFMGVVIVIGVAVVGVTIYNRMNRLGEAAPMSEATVDSQAAAPAAAATDVPLPAFGDMSVPVPEGCRVVEMVPAGDRLLLRLGSGQRCNRILIVDLATGTQLGSIDLVPPQ